MNKILHMPHFYFYDHLWDICPSTAKHGYYISRAHKMSEQLFAMLSHYSKVIVVRIDLSNPVQLQHNKRITDFMRRLSDRLSIHYKLNKIGYAWVRERKISENPHYHLAFFLDGHKVKSAHRIYEYASDIWNFMDGRVWLPKRPQHLCFREDIQSIGDALHRLSYFWKACTQDSTKNNAKSFGTSRLKPKLNSTRLSIGI